MRKRRAKISTVKHGEWRSKTTLERMKKLFVCNFTTFQLRAEFPALVEDGMVT